MKILEIYSPYLQAEKFDPVFKLIFHFIQITLLFYDKKIHFIVEKEVMKNLVKL